MKKGWQTKKLGEVCAFDKTQGIHHGLPYVGLEHIESNTARFIGSSEAQPVKSSTFRFSDEHVLYGRLRPYLNKALAPDFEGHCSTEIFPLKPSPELSREYLLFWLLADATCDRINATCTGARMPRAQMNDVLGFEFPVPPLAEQQRIVGLLDEAFEGLATAKANAEKNLQNARALFESHLQSVFTQGSQSAAEGRGPGWVEKRLDAIAEFSQGIQVGLGDQSNAPAKSSVRFIRIIDYTQGTNDIRYVQDPGRRYWADKSDIVMVRYGTPGLVGRGIEGVIANNLFKISILDGSLTNDFLAYFLSQQKVQDYLSSQGSSTMPALTFTQLGAVMVSFPHELEKQNAIVSKLDDLREETQRLARLYERKLAALEALKESLLHQAFTGAL